MYKRIKYVLILSPNEIVKYRVNRFIRTCQISCLLLILIFQPQIINCQIWEAVPLVSQDILDNGNSGGEGCQVIEALEIDHTDGSFLIMGTDVGGIYRSVNGGTSWAPCNIGYNPRGNAGFAIDPNNSQRVLAIGGNSNENSSHGLYLSTDQGSSWEHVLPIGDYDGYRGFKDKIEFVKSSYDENLGYSTIAYWSSPSGGIYKSTDGGSNWTKVNTSFGDCLLKVNHETGDVYVADSTGFYKSSDGAQSFTNKFSANITDMDALVNAPGTIYLVTANKIFKSTNQGETFSEIIASSFPQNVISMNVSPADNNFMLVCDKVIDWGGIVYYSHDGGTTWAESIKNNENAFIPYNHRHQKFAFHPSDKNKVWAIGGDWISSSKDGGKNFEWDSNGYNGILVGGFFNFNYDYPELLYVGSQDYNGAFTKDGGHSWKYCNASTWSYGGFVYGTYAANENTLIAQICPAKKQDGILGVSRDGGANFTRTELLCTGLDVGCSDPKDSSVLYFSNYYSQDFGYTWQMMEGCMGVLIADHYGERAVYGANGKTAVKSSDKGNTWTTIVSLSYDIRDIAYDHTLDKLYIVTINDRIYQYENSILTEITNLIPDDQYGNVAIRSVAVDPQDPKIVFCAGPENVYKSDASVRMSLNSGQSWEIITPNNRTNNGIETGDGVNEAFAIRVNPITRDLWAAGGCYGLWKRASLNNTKVELINPQKDTSIVTPEQILLSVTVDNSEHPVSKVEFFANAGKLGESVSEPHEFNWENIDVGEYEIYAVVTDNLGNTAYSPKRKLTVLISALPEISITAPSEGSEFEFESDIEIRVDANDSDGSITKVEYFNGTIKIGENSISPFYYTWNNVSSGSYNIIAKATDNTNQVSYSDPLTIKVNLPDGSIEYFEDFNDGLAQGWSILSGDWSVVDGVYSNPTTEYREYSIYLDTTFADYTYSAKASSHWNNWFGLVFNYLDENNFYYLALDAEPTNAEIVEVKNGNHTTLYTSTYIGGGTDYWVEMRLINNGYTSTVYVNEQLVFDQVSTPEYRFGKIGLYARSNPLLFDDISVIGKSYILSDVTSNIKKKLQIYPNPVTTDEFVILTNEQGKLNRLYIFDIEGSLFYSETSRENKFTLKSEKINKPGIYIVKVVSEESIYTGKIVVDTLN